jgi:Uri superfamily endonuclease
MKSSVSKQNKPEKLIQNDQPGTYAMILRATNIRQIGVGKIGKMQVIPGFYVYAGSAFGPGGLRPRLTRHLSKPDLLHWHIDYLCPVTQPIEIWITAELIKLEHAWAGALSSLSEASLPMPGFGSSDCHCKSHLVYLPGRPELDDFKAALSLAGFPANYIQSWPPGNLQNEKFPVK